jgi:RNA-directed DNA polymerase
MKQGNACGAKERRKVESVSDQQTENKSAGVPPQVAKQAEEIHGRWPWVERSVWSERMLRALENGVKGDRWFSLVDKVWKTDNLWSSWTGVTLNQGGAGVDGQTLAEYNRNVQAGIDQLQRELQKGIYQPKPVKRVWIPKPGSQDKRPLGIPAVRDRIVQGAIRNVIEPIFERAFAEHSYGFRPGRGCKDALRRVDGLLHQAKTWVVDVDFKSYFDTIPHKPLMERVQERIADGRLLVLIESYLKAGVLERLKDWEPTEQGTPQGAVISPLLANLYLNPLDHLMARQGYAMTRYADDFVVQCGTEAEAQSALAQIKQWALENGLTVHPGKTRIVNAQEDGFDFLGYRFERGRKTPRKKSMDKFKVTIRSRTRRTQGQGIGAVIMAINPTLKGWFEYFKHSHQRVFPGLDSWIRTRLRNILRRQQHRKGWADGSDYQLWPNRFFENLGLFSLKKARALAAQPR